MSHLFFLSTVCLSQRQRQTDEANGKTSTMDTVPRSDDGQQRRFYPTRGHRDTVFFFFFGRK